MLKILQISDLHLSSKVLPYIQNITIDTWNNFEWALSVAIQLSPDVVVITGDICLETGELETYKKVKSKLDVLNIPYFVIPGNHDCPQMIADIFQLPIQNGKICSFTKEFKNITLGFLDSSDFILNENELDNLLHKRVHYIFVHHPILLGSSKFMDKNYPLKNINEIYSIIQAIKHKIVFFHGHYHADLCLTVSNAISFITPSIFYQIETFTEDLTISGVQPGLRWIEIENHTKFKTFTKYK
jgi:Icc protein